ncbi:MAG: tripartite tricarboxylate transporter substrate binding protein [Burkholderiales bacterium]|nr:tripartite tricarboxylate transporter substrate binding protein [Burkholderiales bacterium]MCW5603338.1 tripartite tricarboxylate transporter substrate binding protein [Burkholderiales bacterium]
MTLRQIAALAITGTLALSANAQAQDYPNRPIRMIVAVPPGGPADTLARLVGPHLNTGLGQTVVIDNRPGANGGIAYDMAARSAPDGYTFVLVAAGVAINPSLYPNVPYHPVKDFAPVTLGITVPNILVVHPSVPARSVKELIAEIKARKGGFVFASAGNGTSGHLALEQFRLSTGTAFVHVPYKGGAPALQETLAGQTQALFSIALAATPQVKAGKVRALAITSAKRSPVAPELPTVAESGLPDFEVIGWFGWLAPAQTNKAIIARLNQELVRALGNAEVRERLLSMATEPVGDKPEEFGRFIRSEHEKWGKVIKAANIKLQ